MFVSDAARRLWLLLEASSESFVRGDPIDGDDTARMDLGHEHSSLLPPARAVRVERVESKHLAHLRQRPSEYRMWGWIRERV